MHLEFTTFKYRFSVTGSVLTIFDLSGNVLRQYFYKDFNTARQEFLAMI